MVRVSKLQQERRWISVVLSIFMKWAQRTILKQENSRRVLLSLVREFEAFVEGRWVCSGAEKSLLTELNENSPYRRLRLQVNVEELNSHFERDLERGDGGNFMARSQQDYPVLESCDQ